MDKYIGKVLDDRYEIVDVLGVGGMSVVYKAKCNRLNRFVALKILKEEYSADESLRRQFHDESQSVAILSHPNIVSVYDVSHYDDTEYIVMELIDGITLKDYLKKRGPLTWKEVTFFSIQIAKALEHAHSRNIIHRDIKPQNIMLLRDGTLKVADFGIARNMASEGTRGLGEAIGSVHYVSPEQAKGSHIDARSDLYSFGVVMYEMLTGRLPFEGDTPVSVAIQHINSMAVPPSTFVDTIPKTLENITMKAMNPSLAKRYASAEEILRDLECFRNDPHFVLAADIPQEPGKPEEKTTEMPSPGTVIRQAAEQREQKMAEKKQPAHQAPKKKAIAKKQSAPKQTRVKTPKKAKRVSASYADAGTFSASILFFLIAVIVILVGAFLFVMKVLNPFGNADAEKQSVPSLINLYYDEVINSNRYAEYTIKAGEYLYNSDFEEGKIIDQEPAANKTIDKGDVITVTVSRGRKSFTLSSFEGKTYYSAESEIKKSGAQVLLMGINSQDARKDTVISTEPAAGTQIYEGDTVTIFYSIGPKAENIKTTVVPDLYGKSRIEALAMIVKASLTPGEELFVDSEEPEGTVVYQTVPAHAEVEEGTVVTYHLSRGITQVEDPLPGTTPTTDPTTPATPANPTGFGLSIDPYPDDPIKRRMNFTVVLTDSSNSISITVKVNNYVEYTGTHYSSEGYITIPLTAYQGYNTIVVTQNDKVTYNQSVNFE